MAMQLIIRYWDILNNVKYDAKMQKHSISDAEYHFFGWGGVWGGSLVPIVCLQLGVPLMVFAYPMSMLCEAHFIQCFILSYLLLLAT